MKLPIYLYGHPVLRKVAQDISPDYPDLEKLIANMWETMYDSDGIGLAAPQIGRDIRLFVIDADALKEDYPETKDFKRVFINAKIVEYSEDKWSVQEGCLSIPGVHEKVERPNTITIEYLNEKFETQKETLSGFAARVVQHEYDHIEGILFTDLISSMRKAMVKSKLKAISEGRVRTHYRVTTGK